jgi:hypothetical protein
MFRTHQQVKMFKIHVQNTHIDSKIAQYCEQLPENRREFWLPPLGAFYFLPTLESPGRPCLDLPFWLPGLLHWGRGLLPNNFGKHSSGLFLAVFPSLIPWICLDI